MLKVAFPSLDHLPQTREAGERRARDMAQWARNCSVQAMQDGAKAQYSDDRCYFPRQIVSKEKHFVGIDGQNCLEIAHVETGRCVASYISQVTPRTAANSIATGLLLIAGLHIEQCSMWRPLGLIRRLRGTKLLLICA